ncbi:MULTISPECIES: hypothetical protein [Acidiphilium]|uniref:hypothetical protein n=1 Tax=Acidiphilium TaxID=522 RepID=UPI002584F634|nr:MULTISPECIES: hypothetical protein [Acidiphilium]HQT86359.1 hypothetical protein [Acidiphilium rubrum]
MTAHIPLPPIGAPNPLRIASAMPPITRARPADLPQMQADHARQSRLTVQLVDAPKESQNDR